MIILDEVEAILIEIDTKPFQGLKRTLDRHRCTFYRIEIDTKPFQGLKPGGNQLQ